MYIAYHVTVAERPFGPLPAAYRQARTPWPTPRERQVLAYHKKYGTTSPLYEKIRAKYPDW